jgi:hypothetical protein
MNAAVVAFVAAFAVAGVRDPFAACDPDDVVELVFFAVPAGGEAGADVLFGAHADAAVAAGRGIPQVAALLRDGTAVPFMTGEVLPGHGVIVAIHAHDVVVARFAGRQRRGKRVQTLATVPLSW